MTSQLRLFTIIRGKIDDVVKAWIEGVYPLRLKHGFTIEAAWVARERNQFIWILSHHGPEDWETKDAAYYASAERAALNPDPAPYLASAEQWFVTPVLPLPSSPPHSVRPPAPPADS